MMVFEKEIFDNKYMINAFTYTENYIFFPAQ